MQWLRTIKSLVRALAAVFVFAQFAGIVSSPLESAQSFATAAETHMHHHHMHAQIDEGSADRHHGDRHRGHVDHCCALHAFFAGIMPPPVAIAIADIPGQQLAADLTDIGRGINRDRLDRPPRPHAVI